MNYLPKLLRSSLLVLLSITILPLVCAGQDEFEAQKLYLEGSSLLQQERLLDGRTKLLEALEADPSFYPTHLLLSGYYIQHVGHFRLALKYVLQAQELFLEQNGPPPYATRFTQAQHANIISLLSQARLNLDDYQGALKELDRFSALGYTAPWYPGTRSWVLMKAGRLEEAIKVARLGVLSQQDRGRTLNMLGILLSMDGDPEAALQVFKEAIDYELSLGSLGQPATPLNNSGEVYKEMFADRKAEAMWYQAKSLPDGCQHVLPSLNLSLLAIDHFALRQAEQSIESFLQCFAQFTLRNGEEHKALVDLAFGRVALHSGRATLAVAHLQDSLEQVQWFGKIGTSSEDLQAAGFVSLAQGYETLANHLALMPSLSVSEWLSSAYRRSLLLLKSWWFKRKGLHVLIEELDDFSDLKIRNTDSLLEYSTLGSLLAQIPPSTLQAKLSTLRKRDSRPGAQPYYTAFLAESYLEHGYAKKGQVLLQKALSSLRPEDDVLLRIHLLARLAQQFENSEPEYSSLVKRLFLLSRAAPLNYGLTLPVCVSEKNSHLVAGGFSYCTDPSWPFKLESSSSQGEAPLKVTFSSSEPRVSSTFGKGKTANEAIKNLMKDLFFLPTGKRKS